MKMKKWMALCIGAAAAAMCSSAFVSAETGISGSVVKAASKQTVDVTDFGAKGSDTKPDTEAIQAALDEVGEAGGGTVNIPAGKYYIDDQLEIHSDTVLQLAKQAEIIRKDKTIPMLRNYTGAQEDVLTGQKYGYTKNITVAGGIWNGNLDVEKGSVPTDLIKIVCATNVTLKDFTVKGVCGDHHVDFASVNGITVDNVTFTGFVYYKGTDYSSLEDGTENKNELNTTSSVTSEALQFDAFEKLKCKNITVTNCKFKKLLSGVGNHHPEVGPENVVIKNNTFEHMANTCVNLYGFINVEVSGNKAADVRAFARVSGGKDCTISGNTMTTFTQKSKNKFNMFRVGDKAELTIANNTITGAGNSAIKIATKSKAVISKNKIKDTVHNAVAIEESTATVKGNVLTNSKNYGVYAVSSNVKAESNTIKNPAGMAIYFKGGSGSISNNKVTTTKSGSAIYIVEKSKVSKINGNIISKPKEAGIYVKGATAKKITGNIVTAPGTRGISFAAKASGQEVSGNKVASPKQDGIYVSESSKVTTIGGSKAGKNIVEGAGVNGIAVKSATAGLISFNQVSGSKSANIRIENAKGALEISKNTLTSAAKQGISCQDTKVTITGNTVKKSGTYGIYLVGSKSDAAIKNNVIDTVKAGNGIRVCEGKAVLKGNNIKNTKSDKICIIPGAVVKQ